MRPGAMLGIGLALIAAAVTGWLVTTVALSFAAQPDVVEDLTAGWTSAGETPLGGSTTVAVPQGRTLVAFLVGTELRTTAGTTAGDCAASADGRPLRLDWPVYINPSLTGVLGDDEEVVAVAAWHNDGPLTRVWISCRAHDSDVRHFVALPTATAASAATPWFQPWAWVGLGAAGAVLTGLAIAKQP